MATHTITIPNWRPALANEWVGRHWSRKHRLRRSEAEMIGAYARACNVPDAGGSRRVTLRVTMPRLADLDAFDKLFLDALVQCRLLLNDDAKGLAGRMTVEITIGPLNTEILLEDVE